MADLYSVISGIQPDQQDIVEAELLSKQILEANFPDLDLREGTGVRDLVLRPAAFLLALCKKGFDYYFDQNTLSQINNDSPTELVNGLMGNLFLERNLGSLAVVNVRLYFARDKNVTLTSGTSFSTDGVLLFFPPATITYPSSALQFDSFQNEYYLDIDLIAASKGVDYNIGTGSLLYFTNFDPFFLHGEINYLAESSTDPETNLEFIARAGNAISTRNLINKPSIDVVLRQRFNYLPRITTIGAGDQEMSRDQVEVAGNVGLARVGTYMSITDLGANLQVGLPDHGFVEGQLVNVVEAGTAANRAVIKRQPITEIIDDAQFKVNLPITLFNPGVFNFPWITPVEDDVFVHQGGAVDIHCSRELVTVRRQYTLDVDGKCRVPGPIYRIVRSLTPEGPLADTVPPGSPFNITFEGWAERSDITLIQDSGNNLFLTMRGNPLVSGRMVQIVGWPALSSVLYFVVSNIINEDTVQLGENLPVYSVGTGLTPTMKYVYPTKDTGFSVRQIFDLDFGVGQAGRLVTLNLGMFSYLDSVQEYLDLSDNRVVCADLLARGFDMYILDINLAVYNITAPTSGEVSKICQDYLDTLSPGQDLVVADLVAELSDKGIDRMRTPLGVVAYYYSKDLAPEQVTTTTSTLVTNVVDVLRTTSSMTVFIVGNVVTTALAI